MAFLIYSKKHEKDKLIYVNAAEGYKLAGWGLVYSLWDKCGKPIKKGWSVTADDILKEHNSDYSANSHSLVIDFHPNSQDRIGLIEIERIHLFTYGDSNKVYWTPMMLELKSIFYEEDYEKLTKEEKRKIISEFEPLNAGTRIFEFLYLNGDYYSWNWGRNGMTNAAFIYDDARRYFSGFFTNGL